MQAGVDHALIPLWLEDESLETTQIYLDANLALKEQVLAKTKPIMSNAGRYRPDDDRWPCSRGSDQSLPEYA